MTQVRYEKINGKLKSVAGANATSAAASSSSPLVPMPDEAVKEAAAEIFQRPRLTNRERLAVECLKPRSVLSLKRIMAANSNTLPIIMQIPRAVRPVPEAQVRPPEVDGRVEDEEVPARLGLLRSQASLNEIGVGL